MFLYFIIGFLAVLVAVNTAIIGLMYTRWGKRLAVIADVQTIARAYYEMAQSISHKAERTLERVPEASKEAIREATAPNGSASGIMKATPSPYEGLH